MRGKQALVIALFILLLSGAAGAATSFSGWIYSGESVTYNNREFILNLNAQGDQLWVISEGQQAFIGEGKCKDMLPYIICFNQSLYMSSEEQYKGQVTLGIRAASLSISREFSNTLLEVGEEFEVEVLIENTGDEKASDITYADVFPDAFEVYSCTSCDIHGQMVVWQGSLEKDRDATFSYLVRAVDQADVKLKARMTYFDGYSEQEDYSDEVELETVHLLVSEVSASLDEVELGDRFDLTVNISNTGTDRVGIESLSIYVPSGLEVMDYDDHLTRSGNLYMWSGNIDEEESRDFVLYLRAVREGFSTILLTGVGLADQAQFDIEEELQLEVEGKELTLTTNVENGDVFDEGEELTLYFFALNYNSSLSFSSLVPSFTTELFPTDVDSIASVPPNVSKKLHEVTIILPHVESATSYKIYLNLSYQDEFGKAISSDIERAVTVDPIQDLSISQSLSSAKVYRGDDVVVTVSITNGRNVDLEDIRIRDVLPPSADPLGPTTRTLSLNASDREEAYSYSLEFDAVGTYTITTVATYGHNGIAYEVTKDTEVTVEEKDLDLAVTRSPEKTTVYMGEIVDVSYTLTNNEDEPLSEITIRFPQIAGADTVGAFEHYVDGLDPGETITLEGIERLRPKVKGSLQTGSANVTFKNDEGSVFEATTSHGSLTVNQNYLDGPVVLLEKTAPKQADAGDQITVTIEVTNAGSSTASVALEDGGNRQTFDLASGASRTFNFSRSFPTAGKHTLPAAKASYSHLTWDFTAYSDEPEVTVSETVAPPPPVEEVAEQEQVEDVQPVTNPQREETPPEVEEKPGLFDRISAFFKKMLSFTDIFKSDLGKKNETK